MQTNKLRTVSVAEASAIIRQKTAGASVSMARKYTYVIEGECEGGRRARLKWKLRDDRGTFDEDWCDLSRDGRLDYIADATIVIDGITIEGWAYNGTDEYGTFGYIFGTRDFPEYGGYVVLMGSEYVDDASYTPYFGFICSRKKG